MSIRKLIGIVICIVGLLVFFYPNFREWGLKADAARVVAEFENIDTTAADTSDAGEGTDTKADTSSASGTVSAISYDKLYKAMAEYNRSLLKDGQKLRDVFNYEDTPVDMSEYGGDRAIGTIEIPAIGCTLPLFLGASSDHLIRGAAVMGNTSMPIGGKSANCVIAGHRGYAGVPFFQYIDSIAVGDTVVITNPWGKLYYKAVSVTVTVPTDEEPLLIKEGEDAISLVSCHPYMLGGGPQRIVVKCLRDYGTTSIVVNGDTDAAVQTSSTAGITPAVTDMTVEDYTYTGTDRTVIVLERAVRIVLPILIIILMLVILFHKDKRTERK